MKHKLQTIVGGPDAVARCSWCGWAPPVKSIDRLAYCTEQGSACPSCRDEHWNSLQPWKGWRDALNDAIYAHMGVEQAYNYIVSACQHFGFGHSPSFIWDVCEQALSKEAWRKRKARRQNPAPPTGACHFYPGRFGLWERWRQLLTFPVKDGVERAIVRGVHGLPVAEAIAVLQKYLDRQDRQWAKHSRMREGLEVAQAYLEKKRRGGERVTVSKARAAVREALDA